MSRTTKKRFSISNKGLAQILAHMGIGILIIGITGSSILKEERIQFQKIDEIIRIKNYDVKFLGVKNVEGTNYISKMGLFEISKNGQIIKLMQPEKRFYNSGKQVTTEAAISSSLLGDLYIALGDVNEKDKEKKQWTTRIWYNPYTIWIWISVLFLAAAGMISFTNTIRLKK